MPPTVVRELRVMVVDDDQGDVMMIREVLGASGWQHAVEVARDGEEALASLRRQGTQQCLPDVILLDLNMPRMGGLQVLKLIKDDERLRLIPVVVLTTSQAPEDIRSSYESHANAFVTKPMSLGDFTATVRDIYHFFGAVASLPRQ